MSGYLVLAIFLLFIIGLFAVIHEYEQDQRIKRLEELMRSLKEK